MCNESYRTYLSIRAAFDRMRELGVFLSFLNTQIDIYGEEISVGEIKKILLKEFCDVDNKLRECCKEIKL